MTKQMTKMAMMMVLAIGLMASAATAQNKNGGFAPVGIFSGVETSPGICEIVSAMCSGNTFVLNSYGEWETHNLTVSLNYSLNTYIPNNFIVTSGSWSLTVIRDKQSVGTLYGEIQTGSINLITDSNGEAVSKQVRATLRSTGGLGIFAGKDSKNISGMYEAITDSRSKETSGSAGFNF
ncbi:hypothetical protein BH10ACI1_BH10ACI1_15270 [soil metagenome]